MFVNKALEERDDLTVLIILVFIKLFMCLIYACKEVLHWFNVYTLSL